jgi:hypothetical protein
MEATPPSLDQLNIAARVDSTDLYVVEPEMFGADVSAGLGERLQSVEGTASALIIVGWVEAAAVLFT